MNLLDLVPAFQRHLRQYQRADDTDSKLAAYLADAVEAMGNRWTRDYEITYTSPETYEVDPDITARDKRPIILAASIIYKMGSMSLASFRDGDFAWDPQQGRTNPLATDIAELDRIIPAGTYKLAAGFTAPLRGFNSVLNPESYMFILGPLV